MFWMNIYACIVICRMLMFVFVISLVGISDDFEFAWKKRLMPIEKQSTLYLYRTFQQNEKAYSPLIDFESFNSLVQASQRAAKFQE
jgi:hypothetical protein